MVNHIAQMRKPHLGIEGDDLWMLLSTARTHYLGLESVTSYSDLTTELELTVK